MSLQSSLGQPRYNGPLPPSFLISVKQRQEPVVTMEEVEANLFSISGRLAEALTKRLHYENLYIVSS